MAITKVRIITPVKDSIDTSIETFRSIRASVIQSEFNYTVYNDFSTHESTERLVELSGEMGFSLVNLADVTTHPSPNYLLVLKEERRRCIEDDAALIIVESDVIVSPNTLQGLINGANAREDCGIAAAVTVDDNGEVNYPYLHVKGRKEEVIDSRRHCSFCCSLLTTNFLKKFDFDRLDSNNNWHDVAISHASLQEGFHNYVFMSLPVIHHPHSSRPWKKLKYTNPLLYYWRKFTKGLDKI